MTEEQIKEVMRLADDIADYAWKQGLSDGAYSQSDHDRKSCDASRAELEAYLRTIGEPESVNAELLAIVHQTVGMIENTSIETGCCCCGDGMDGHASPMICGHSATDQGAYLADLLYEDAKAAVARAESAIETPAKVSPCAGHAAQQEADASRDWPEDFPHENGQYMNTCHVCKNTFIGHKHRVVCKVCKVRNNGFIRAQQEADEAGGA